MEFRARSAEEEVELLRKQQEELQSKFSECLHQKSELEVKISSLSYESGSPKESDILVKHLQEELRNYESEVREARKLKFAHESIELMNEKLLEEKSRRERAELQLSKLQEYEVKMTKLEDDLSVWKLMIQNIPDVSCCDDVPLKIAALQREVIDNRKKFGEVSAQLKQVEVILDTTQLDKQKTETEAALAKEEVGRLEGEVSRISLMLSAVSEERNRLKSVIEDFKSKNEKGGESTTGGVMQELELSLLKKESYIEELERDLDAQKEIHYHQRDEIKSLHDRLNNEARRIESLERESDCLRSEISLLESKLAIDVEQEEDEGGLVGETFTDYRPPKVSIGLPHPDPIVETSSLSAIQPPEPTYDLKIKDELEHTRALSCLQIETLVYACQRHQQHLQCGNRAGFFVGDGAGVGKGRTIAGLILENWHCGRKKAIWISIGSDLKFDARRDLDDMGASFIEVHALNKLPYSKLDSKSVGVKDGVVFLTYNSLIASSEKGRSRLQQLVQWFGSEFDGLLVFDECHKAKNLVPEAGSQPTRTGEAVLDIQSRIPEARVVYCSATGASEPRNLGYMVRLGLWGPGTSFPDFQKFLGAMEKGGVGALELVAMDMKARGMYVCRTLSYKGAEFEVVEAPLEPDMMEMYKKAAEFWAELRVELLSASAFLVDEKPNSSQLWRLYWSSHQRFFRHLCMSAKVPATLKLAKRALMEDKCVVIGLQSTGEARTEEAVTKYGVELDDFISGPRELLLKFVEDNYPLPDKPEPLDGESDTVELQRKRHSTGSDVSLKGRVRKVARLKPSKNHESDEESETDSACEPTESDDDFQISDSAGDSTESDDDDEFQICEMCNGESESKRLIRCSCCGQLLHHSCIVPPIADIPSEDWSCQSCKEKTEEFLKARRVYLAELMKRYEVALDRKSKILEIIRLLDLPNNPLDDIIDQLGGPDRVAEITGRKGMLVRASTGKGVTYQQRNTKDVSMEMVNMHEKQQFMDGKKLVAIISEAGSAGVSLQADRRAINQKRRVHLTLELPWSADRAIQQFGRTHRSNQASAPEYRLLFTDLGGERRFASIVAKRLESLGALTQGDRRAGPSLSAYNYDSLYGKKALVVMYKGIMEQDTLPVVPPGCSAEKPETTQEFILKAKAALISVGIVRDTVLGNGKDSGKLSGRIIDSDMHDVGRFLNRLLGLPPEIQNRLFELFVKVLDLLIHNARIEGNLDSGIIDMRASVIELKGTPKTVHVDQMSGASTVLFTFSMNRGVTWEAANAMLDGKQKDGIVCSNDGFYESKREWLGKRHFILAFESTASGLYKIVRPAVGESVREMSLSELRNKYRKLSSLDKACKDWEGEYEVSSAQCMHGPNCKIGSFCTVGRRVQEVYVLGGIVLPVWGTIEKALSKQGRQSHKRLRIVRLETTSDNNRIVGVLVPNGAVEAVLEDLAWVEEVDD